ncbi:hypothetical protein pb186bvf_013444 [Paramecium bursaria]
MNQLNQNQDQQFKKEKDDNQEIINNIQLRQQEAQKGNIKLNQQNDKPKLLTMMMLCYNG